MEKKIEAVKYALENQIEWQKYAENKTFILFTLAGATLLTIFSKNFDGTGKDDIVVKMHQLSPTLKFFCIATFISFTLCVISFLVFFFRRKSYTKHAKLMSWNFARKKTIAQLKNIVNDYDEDANLEDLLNEHLVGCRLTYIKYTLFNWGMMIFFVGFLVYIVPILFKIEF